VAWIGFVSLVIGLVMSSAAFLLEPRGIITKNTAGQLGAIGIALGVFVGLPCLLVPVIARIAAALERRKKLSTALYRLLMLVVGYGFCAAAIYACSQGMVARGISTGIFAITILWYGAFRGENPDVG
jgi:hypothetical protein